jgi:hypothetical protein
LPCSSRCPSTPALQSVGWGTAPCVCPSSSIPTCNQPLLPILMMS